jgi:hypothetical protein
MVFNAHHTPFMWVLLVLAVVSSVSAFQMGKMDSGSDEISTLALHQHPQLAASIVE